MHRLRTTASASWIRDGGEHRKNILPSMYSLIVLLPKSDGGFRPIGLFPTIIRLWMRSRIFIAKEWEASTANPAIFGGLGKCAQAAAYQTALVVEIANLDEDAFSASMLDLVKAFETVPHDVLVGPPMPKVIPYPCFGSASLRTD